MGGMAIGLIFGAFVGAAFCSDPLTMSACIKEHVPIAAAGGATLGGLANALWDRLH